MSRLFRYTSLPVLLDILSKKKLTLLNPASWDDRNDSYYLELYKSKNNLKTLLALCFTYKPETYHLWKVFSDGIAGVCIQFDEDKLLEWFDRVSEVGYGSVSYPLIKELRDTQIDIDDLPYIKRRPYRDEEEFRVIYIDSREECSTKEIDISLDSIQKINLSPWMPDGVVETVRSVIGAIPGCSELRVSKTTLVENKVWKNIATKQHGTEKTSARRRR